MASPLNPARIPPTEEVSDAELADKEKEVVKTISKTKKRTLKDEHIKQASTEKA